MGNRSRLEQETIIRWNRLEPTAVLGTGSEGEAKRWERRGWKPRRVGTAWWEVIAPKSAVTIRGASRVLASKKGRSCEGSVDA